MARSSLANRIVARHDGLYPLLTALFLYLALPSRGFWPLGLVGLAPLIAFALRRSPTKSFLGGFLGGVLLYAAAMPWVTGVMTMYGGLWAPLAVGVALLLHGYLAAYVGLFAWLVSRVGSRSAKAALGLAPILWAGLEWMRGWLFSGFPWIPVGLSQWKHLPMVQHAEWGGIYSVSALVALPSVGLVAIARRGTRRMGVAALAIAAILEAAGAWRLHSVRRSVEAMSRPLKVGIVQAVVPLEERSGDREGIERRHFVMSRDLVRQGADALVWSESSLSIPDGFWRNDLYRQRLGAFARSLERPILFGSTSRDEEEGRQVVYNSAFVLDEGGALAGRYDKQHLVPFGEYVPAARLLFFAEKLVEEVGDFGRGDGPVLMPLAGARVGVPICYEIIFPELVRAFANAGAEVIVTITNDAWFGRSAAPEQHFAHAVFRAVEVRRFVLRCANTGISGLVLPTGKVETRSAVFAPALFVGAVEPLSGLTFYARWGDVLPAAGLLCAVVAAMLPRKVG